MCGRHVGKDFLTLLQHCSGAVRCPTCLYGADGRWPECSARIGAHLCAHYPELVQLAFMCSV
jgi:hypothetical protein